MQDASHESTNALLRAGSYDEERRLVGRHYINVRFASTIEDEERARVERQYGLLRGVRQEASTWRYVLQDTSPTNALALMRDAAVEDTHGLDRVTGAVAGGAGSPDAGLPRDEVVIGTVGCAAEADVAIVTLDTPEGHVAATVDAPVPGVLFFSEPYYPERRAFVDGAQVPQMKANLAFTAVRVPAGAHRVELRFVPSSFHQGLAGSAVTCAVWLGIGFTRRGGRRDAA